MHCLTCQDWLQENWVDLPRTPAIQDHLSECPTCRAHCRQIARMANVMEGMASIQPPGDLRRKILAALSKQECPTLVSRRGEAGSRRRFRTSFLVAACILVGAMGPVLPSLFPNKTKPSLNASSTEDTKLISQIQPGSILLKPWPEWKDALQEEGKKALETAYRCVRPPAEAGWVTMTRALREVPGSFLLASGH